MYELLRNSYSTQPLTIVIKATERVIYFDLDKKINASFRGRLMDAKCHKNS